MFFSFSLFSVTPAEVFPCKFFNIYGKIFFKEQPRATASMTSKFTWTGKNIS